MPTGPTTSTKVRQGDPPSVLYQRLAESGVHRLALLRNFLLIQAVLAAPDSLQRCEGNSHLDSRGDALQSRDVAVGASVGVNTLDSPSAVSRSRA